MKKNRIDIITMGCSKNLIDSERIIRRLHAKGYDAVHDSGNPEGEYVVVNTCGFIADAKEESIEMLLDLAKLKLNPAGWQRIPECVHLPTRRPDLSAVPL